MQPDGFRQRIVVAAAWSARHAIEVVALAIALAVASVWFVATHLAIDTDNGKLISPDLPWRQRSAAFDRAFPQKTDVIAIVVDGATPDLAERAAATLTERLAANPSLIRDVHRPDGGPFFDRNGLLYLDVDALGRTTDDLVSAQPVIGTLAADPSVRGLMTTLQLALEGVRRKDATLDRLGAGLAALADTAEAVARGEGKPLSWRSMFGGEPPSPRELRRFVLAQPVLDYAAIQPGAKASAFIRRTASDAGFDPAHGVRVRLTGDVPMSDEEFVTLEDHAGRNAAVMLVALFAMLWLAVRSGKAMVGIAVALFAGLAVTAAIGLAIYGALNLISVAFAVLFVGLGVDFGIQYAVSYRAHAAEGGGPVEPSKRAAHEVGTSLALAAVAISAGFFAFEPTDYRGVSELGVIAGIGMLVAFVASVSVLPAMLALLRTSGRADGMRFAALAPLDRLVRVRRRPVLAAAAIVALASFASLPWLHFDFDPLHLRSADTEAVSTILDLSRDPLTTPNTIDVLAPDLEAAKALADRLAKLPEVSHALTLASLIPSDQDRKLAIIQDAASLLGPSLDPGAVAPAPTDAQNVQAMKDAARDLAAAAADDPTNAAAAAATRAARALTALADGPADRRQALDAALVPGLRTTLLQLKTALQAQPVTLQSMPKALVADWVAADGRARVEVYPKEGAESGRLDPTADASIRRFIAAVRTVAPDATGTPISIQESAATIVHAFAMAGLWASIAITVLLVVVLRNARDVLVTLASLAFGGLVTLGVSVVLRIPLNYENIIALPLLFGIGVAFNIYFVNAWRRGVVDLLQTSIARAVVFSAATTATAFGSLWLSRHPGTASMGKLLALSLACTLVAALVVLPALLGPPPAGRRAVD